MSVEMEIQYRAGLKCVAKHLQSGAKLETEAPKDNGGSGMKFSPTDLVATALGTCVLTIMGLAAQKAGVDMGDVSAHVVKDMVAEPHRMIGSIKVAIKVPNWRNIPEADRKRIECAAMACPVKNSLHPDVKLTLTFEYPD